VIRQTAKQTQNALGVMMRGALGGVSKLIAGASTHKRIARMQILLTIYHALGSSLLLRQGGAQKHLAGILAAQTSQHARTPPKVMG